MIPSIPETDIIKELLPTVPYGSSLFHYTNPDGLLGILESKSLHCSHIYFMNDLEENLNLWKYFFPNLSEWAGVDTHKIDFINLVNQHFKQWDVFTRERIENDYFVEFKIDDFLLYVLSFSHVEDDLSQWRAYSGTSYGFALKFHLNEGFIESQTNLLDPGTGKRANCKILIRDCVYRPEEKVRIIYGLLDFTFKRFKANPHNWNTELFFNLLTLNIFFKNEKFECEKECRVAILPFEKPDLIRYKKGKSFLVPYLELDITPNFLNEICIGPSPFPMHSIASVRMLLKKLRKKYGPIGATTSRIPYRFW